ncbi:IclR family transcriptional regulator [Bauldia litoralis]|uniref:Transcriptional regulator, IclR family n=1 Tax=Bauldia litoralis TaxID=665467 RepID=A0A1G6BRD3_9HYPH|nr:IclR family transcriptional regulator [Bauldia litoralis]SDB23180.1 transcriptional regulator, IclR family [Bauldia litoralis]
MSTPSVLSDDDPVPGTAAASETPRRTRVSGIDRALQILDHLYHTEKPWTAYAIAKAIGAPLSTTYAIIDDLIARDLLTHRGDKEVWLGPRLYHYGLAYAHSLDFLSRATHEMHELCREVGETVQICGRDGDRMVVLAMADGPGHFRVTSEIGTRVPLNWTASGRLLVGHLGEDERLNLFRQSAKMSPTERAETDPVLLAGLSRQALKDRLSIQISETDFLVSCVASPICNRLGECVATISIVLPEHKVVEKRDYYGDAVRRASEKVERALGWRDP